MKPLKATSLHQPWASGMAAGIKAIETRGFRTHHRGDLAICAAKAVSLGLGMDWAKYQVRHGFPEEIPLGAVVCVVEVFDVKSSSELWHEIGDLEKDWGNYGPGRFGWMTRNLRPLRTPVAMRGQQGMWTLPDDVTARVWEEVAAYVPQA